MGTGETANARGTGAQQRPRSLHQGLDKLVLSTVLFSTGILGGCAGFVSGTKTTTVQAAFQVSPTTVSFGKVGVGKQTTQVIAVANTGSMPVSITQATVSNPQFSLTGVTLPLSIATGQAGNFTVAVTPTAAGTLSGTMTVLGSAGAAAEVISLSATAVAAAPQISLSSSPVEFGTVKVGATGNQNLLISNNGNADLTISVISVGGAPFGVSGITTPKTVPAGQAVSAALTFQPTTAGAASGTLFIASNDPDNPAISVTLTGTGSTIASGQLEANPTSVSFGSVNIGSNSTQPIVLTNTGTAAIQISSIAVIGAGFNVEGITAPLILNPSATATLNAIFSPTEVGNVTGSVRITTDLLHSPLTIFFTGTGAQAGLSITPASFAYGSVEDGKTKSQNFTLTNTGGASLGLSQLSISGAGYSLTGLVTPTTIAAGASATFSAVFAPTTAGALPGTITISSNAPGSPSTVALSGTGVAATVTLSANPTSLAFGSANAGTTISKSLTLTNNGTGNVTISQVTVSAKDITTSGFQTPLTLTPGQSQTMNVAFQPATAETVAGNVTVTNSLGTYTVVAVSGTGLQAGISLTPASTNFGSVPVGSTNSQTIQIGNTGNGVLTITQASVTGSGFSATGLTLPLSINAGQASTFNAQYLPSAVGSAAGTITIVSNAPTSPSVVALSGTGAVATQLLSLSTNMVSFGNVDTGTSPALPVTLINIGNTNVQISGIAASGTGYSLSGASVPVTLTPAQTLTFNVIFSPTVAGSVSGSVTVGSNATGSPSTIALSGSGVVSVPHSVSLAWTASTGVVSGYNVYRTTTSGTDYAKLNAGLVSLVSYTDSTVLNGTTYYYVTTAVDASGNESFYSNEAVAVIP